MKPLFLSAALGLLGCPAIGQQRSGVDSLDFCGFKMAVAPACQAESTSQLKCDDFSANWLYVSANILPDFAVQTVRRMEQKFDAFQKAEMPFLLKGQAASGYVLHFRARDGRWVRQIIAYGSVHAQPVILQIIYKTAGETLYIPEPLQEIIAFVH